MSFAQVYEQHIIWRLQRLWLDKDTERDIKSLLETTYKTAANHCRGIALDRRGVPCDTTAEDIANAILKEFELDT